jgi:hypothetical protein
MEPGKDEQKEYRKRLTEYNEVGVNWRHWGDARLKQVVVYLTAMTVVAAAALSDKLTTDSDVKIALSIIGIAVAVLFAILDERAAYYRRAYLQRAVELEEQLGFWQYRLTSNIYWRPLRSEVVYGVFFIFIAGAWLFYIKSLGFLKGHFYIVWIVFAAAALTSRYASRYLQFRASDLDDRRAKYPEKIAAEKKKREEGFT